MTHLKAGTTPIDAVQYINVGNERWYKAANEFFSDIEEDGDSLVRFIKGNYGDGKTHFLGMLRSLALEKGWLVSFVTAENTPLSKFDRVYSEIMKNMTLPSSLPRLAWLPGADRKGAAGLLAAFFAKWYIEIAGNAEKTHLNSMRIIQELPERTAKVLATMGLNDLVANAVRAYVRAGLSCAGEKMNAIVSWAEGGPVVIAEDGISKRVDQKLAMDVMRAISLLVRATGGRGVLVLLDEAERIMDQSRAVRKKSYGVIRDLLDNADGQGGMHSSIMYIAATPEVFSSEKGFAEYDALRSRLVGVGQLQIPGLIDWRSVIVDLTRTPLPHDALTQLAAKVRQVHSIARGWQAEQHFTDAHINALVKKIEGEVYQFSKPRMVASCVATLLDIAEQNRDIDMLAAFDAALGQTAEVLSKMPKTDSWD